MKILQINKFFYPRGGAENYFLALNNLLTAHGHEVIHFSQKNEKNLPSRQTPYFISNLDLEKFRKNNIFRLGRIFWSPQANRKLKKLIRAEKPDLVHIHNIYHQISPSILPIIKKEKLPIIMTIHDFKLIKPDYTLWVNQQKNRHKNSRLADYLIKAEFYWHKWRKIYQKNIDQLIVPSIFVKNKLVERGWPENKIAVLPHFIDFKKYEPSAETKSDYILYFGRLDQSKGVDTLIGAWSQSQARQNFKLKIAGDGPLKEKYRQLTKELKIQNQVEFLGHQNSTALIKLIKHSYFTILPSRVHETFGLSVLESHALNKPVIASWVGALPEIVQSGKTGELIEPDNQVKLQATIDQWMKQPQLVAKMGENAGKIAREKYQPERHYQTLIKIYEKLIQ